MASTSVSTRKRQRVGGGDATSNVLYPLLWDRHWYKSVQEHSSESPELVRQLVREHVERRVSSNAYAEREFQTQWREAISSHLCQLTDGAIDDFFELCFKGAAHSEMCSFMERTMVAVYKPFGAAVAPSRWSYNMTGTGLFSLPADSVERQVPRGSPRRTIVERLVAPERQLRMCAKRIRTYLESSQRSARRIILFPVVHVGHFWLYIVNYDNATIEYYNSMPAYCYHANTHDCRVVSECSVRTRSDYLEHVASSSSSHSKQPPPPPLSDAERQAVVVEARKRVTHTTPDVSAFGASLVWFFANYFGKRMRLVNFMGSRPVQQNGTDCGVFVCAYAYSRIVLGESYDTIVRTVNQQHINGFRVFMRRMIDACFAAESDRRVKNDDDDDMSDVEVLT